MTRVMTEVMIEVLAGFFVGLTVLIVFRGAQANAREGNEIPAILMAAGGIVIALLCLVLSFSSIFFGSN